MQPAVAADPRPFAPARRRPAEFAGRCGVIFLPAAMLGLGAVAEADGVPIMYWVGAGLLTIMGSVLLPQGRLTNPATGLAVIAEYVLAQAWLWYNGARYHGHWYHHFALGGLLVVPLLLFAAITLERSGAPAMRRARKCVGRLLRRTQWPTDLSLCQTLPDVTGLREAVVSDATPALALLDDPRAEVRTAALSALAYRTAWRPGEAERVQQAARRAEEPAVRAAAVRALANTRDPFIVETIAHALRDPDAAVRRSAAEVLLWDGERRWGWVRYSVHAALADAKLLTDGPLPLGGVTLPPQAVRDLQEWAAEGGGLGTRAAQTLVAYYAQVLNARPDAAAVAEQLKEKVLDPLAPTTLRVELAQLLADQKLLDLATREGMLSPDHPVPVRLVGAEAALAFGRDDRAERALREMARRPNREIALTIAQILQRQLGLDLGLDLHHMPAAHTRRAAEITRRVMEWAAEEDDPEPGRRRASEWDIPPPPEPGPRRSHS